MNLPFIFDITIGIIFIYLTLSLLASEIQELVTTLLQWRAVHFKESIEGILAGDSRDSEELARIRELANALYAHPLIEVLNQEAKGNLARIPRYFNRFFGSLYRQSIRILHKVLGKAEPQFLFGKNKFSGPSYIDFKTLSTSFLETIGISQFALRITTLKLQLFVQRELLQTIAVIIQDKIAGFSDIEDSEDSEASENPDEPASASTSANLNQLSALASLDVDEDWIGYSSPREELSIMRNFNRLKGNLRQIIQDYKNNEISLAVAVDRISDSVNNYVARASRTNSELNDKIADLTALRDDLFGESPPDSPNPNEKNQTLETTEKTFLKRRLQISISETIGIIKACCLINKIWQHPNYRWFIEMADQPGSDDWETAFYNQLREDFSTPGKFEELVGLTKPTDNHTQQNDKVPQKIDPVTKQNIRKGLTFLAASKAIQNSEEFELLETKVMQVSEIVKNNLPESLEQNLTSLAQQAQNKLEDVKDELERLQDETAKWFNRSMDRASGVYKRNARLVALLIGFIVAVMINADTLHIVQRLASDQPLRDAISQSASSFAEREENLSALTTEIEQASSQIPLPIGWGESNRNNQRTAIQPWETRFGIWGSRFRYALGWLISGIAISMGASFWYGILGKVIDIRSTGKKTDSDVGPGTAVPLPPAKSE
ncbi:MAG: hypothetical protein ACFE0I_09200 [Elainellaceae cyanobacterium]